MNMEDELRIQNFRPDEFFTVNCDAPLEPFFVFRVPAETVDGKGVEEFVGKNDSVESLNR
jgi:hypothetical protein